MVGDWRMARNTWGVLSTAGITMSSLKIFNYGLNIGGESASLSMLGLAATSLFGLQMYREHLDSKRDHTSVEILMQLVASQESLHVGYPGGRNVFDSNCWFNRTLFSMCRWPGYGSSRIEKLSLFECQLWHVVASPRI